MEICGAKISYMYFSMAHEMQPNLRGKCISSPLKTTIHYCCFDIFSRDRQTDRQAGTEGVDICQFSVSISRYNVFHHNV